MFGGYPGWFGKGYLAVDFFAMLSGFLMVLVAEPRFAQRRARAIPFLLARFRRFWPMMAIGFAIGLPYLWVSSHSVWQFFAAAGANSLFLPYPLRNLVFALNVPAWTVFFELACNIAHVAVLRRVSTPRLTLLVLALLVVTVLTAQRFGSLDLGARPETLLAGFPRIFFAYTAGMLIGRLSGGQSFAPVPAPVAIVAMPLAMIAAWRFGWSGWPFDLAFVVVLCPLVIAGALRIVRQTRLGWFSAALSFPLFATHVPVLEAVRQLGYGVAVAVPLALALAGGIVIWQARRSISL